MNNITHIVCSNCSGKNRVPTDRLGENPICARCKTPLINTKPVELDGVSLAKFIRGNDQLVVIDFWASWCQPCISMAPQYADAAKQLPHVRFAKLQTDKYEQAAAVYHIRSLPTLVAFRNGKEIDRFSGMIPTSQIIQWVNSQ